MAGRDAESIVAREFVVLGGEPRQANPFVSLFCRFNDLLGLSERLASSHFLDVAVAGAPTNATTLRSKSISCSHTLVPTRMGLGYHFPFYQSLTVATYNPPTIRFCSICSVGRTVEANRAVKVYEYVKRQRN